MYLNVSMHVDKLKVNLSDDEFRAPNDPTEIVATLDAGELGNKRMSLQLTLDQVKQLAMDFALAAEAVERGDTHG